MVKNRKCIACGTKYSYCPDCSRADALKPAWYNDFCCESCKDLWFTLTRYNMNRLTKAEAKSAILKLDIKPIESYSQFVQSDYARVFETEKKSRKIKKPEPVVEVEEIIEEPTVALAEESESHEVVIKEK